jgi:acyl dehydratase
MGLFWEDFEPGVTLRSPTRTVTEADVVLFAGLTGDHNELHTSATYAARDTPFGQRVAHGLLCLGVCNGLFAQAGLYEGTALALLGLDEWRFVAPVFLGDTVRAEWTTVERRISRSRPETGVVRARVVLRKQDDTMVQEGIVALLFRRRDAAPPGAAGIRCGHS